MGKDRVGEKCGWRGPGSEVVFDALVQRPGGLHVRLAVVRDLLQAPLGVDLGNTVAGQILLRCGDVEYRAEEVQAAVTLLVEMAEDLAHIVVRLPAEAARVQSDGRLDLVERRPHLQVGEVELLAVERDVEIVRLDELPELGQQRGFVVRRENAALAGVRIVETDDDDPADGTPEAEASFSGNLWLCKRQPGAELHRSDVESADRQFVVVSGTTPFKVFDFEPVVAQ